MRNRKNGTAICFLILYFSFLLFGNEMFSYKNENNNIITKLPFTSATYIYEWNTTWGGSNDDRGYGITVDFMGNIFITGQTGSYGVGEWNVFLLKYDSDGNLLWNTTWGGSSYDCGNGIAVDGSGNIYITGVTTSYGVGEWNVFLLKYDSDGNLLWNTTWGWYGGYDCGYGIAVDASGNVFITGSTNRYPAYNLDVFLLKYNTSGNLLWESTWGGSEDDYGNGIVLDSSGKIIIAGQTESFGAAGIDTLLIKFDLDGDVIWNTTWGDSNDDRGYGTVVDGSENILIAGYTYSWDDPGDRDTILLKYDPNGNLLWNTTWGGSETDEAYGVVLDGSGNIIIIGDTYSYGGYGGAVFLLKYSPSGNLIWNITRGGALGFERKSMVIDGLGNIFITGSASNNGIVNVILLKYGVDSDEDNLTDNEEFNLGTDPNDSDSDDDGLNDGSEINTHGTDPNDSDSDDDGLNDGSEVNTHVTDPNDPDSDDDGLNDGSEINTHGTDPNDSDSDDDIMPDGWEVSNNLDPLVDDSSGDLDDDSLSNLEEYQHNADPFEPDSDDDLMPDGWEVSNSLNPLVDDSSGDLDADGLTNLEECQHNTDPNDPDSDNDGFTDGQEIHLGTDPHSFIDNWLFRGILITICIIGSILSYIVIKKKMRKRRKRKEKEKNELEKLETERIEREKQLRIAKEKEILEKIRKVLNVSTRIKLKIIREFLEIDERTFNKKIIDWASEFDFQIDGEYLIYDKENISDFIDELDKQFDTWRKEEEERTSKP